MITRIMFTVPLKEIQAAKKYHLIKGEDDVRNLHADFGLNPDFDGFYVSATDDGDYDEVFGFYRSEAERDNSGFRVK